MTPADGYDAAIQSIAWIDRSDRFRLEVTGPDRAKFLHNLSTNDVKRLPAGGGCESFITSLQGKTLGYVTLLATDDTLLLRSDPGAWPHLAAHFEKYGLFDDVAWHDASAETFEWHVCGPHADQLVEKLFSEVPAPNPLAHRLVTIGDASIRLVRENPTGRGGWTLIGRQGDRSTWDRALHEAGPIPPLSPAAFEALRIEAGTPVFGKDVTPDNLPQEIDRDRQAISFVKGCYLGQETVARIDALGHVNKLLRGLKFEGEIPPPGTSLESDGKVVGTVSSSADSPGWHGPIGLALVRRAQADAGTRLEALMGETRIPAIVRALPMLPPTP